MVKQAADLLIRRATSPMADQRPIDVLVRAGRIGRHGTSDVLHRGEALPLPVQRLIAGLLRVVLGDGEPLGDGPAAGIAPDAVPGVPAGAVVGEDDGDDELKLLLEGGVIERSDKEKAGLSGPANLVGFEELIIPLPLSKVLKGADSYNKKLRWNTFSELMALIRAMCSRVWTRAISSSLA